jgi:uncharacterized protein (DUF433 family)
MNTLADMLIDMNRFASAAMKPKSDRPGRGRSSTGNKVSRIRTLLARRPMTHAEILQAMPDCTARNVSNCVQYLVQSKAIALHRETKRYVMIGGQPQ